MLVFFVCGWSARSPKSLGLLAAAAFLPLPAWQIAFSFVANTPIGHDLKVTDLAYWAGLAIQFLICVSIAVLGAGFSWVARRPTAA